MQPVFRFVPDDRLGTIENLRVTILGDLQHSRVARSNIHLLGKFGCQFTLCGPAMWVPPELEKIGAPGVSIRRVFQIEEALEGADVLLVLRVQTERQHEPSISPEDYVLGYQLNSRRLRRAKPQAIVLHPGPMNRGIEITPDVADARMFEDRLKHAYADGGFLVLTVKPSKMRSCEAEQEKRGRKIFSRGVWASAAVG